MQNLIDVSLSESSRCYSEAKLQGSLKSEYSRNRYSREETGIFEQWINPRSASAQIHSTASSQTMYIHRSRQEAMLISPRLTVAILPTLARSLTLFSSNFEFSKFLHSTLTRGRIIPAISHCISGSVDRSKFPCFPRRRIFSTPPSLPAAVENDKFYRERVSFNIHRSRFGI